ncbi:SOS response-associated peptidase [Paenibacillus sp. GCM10023252]|uniref:SOS response-associated peptidase n=1 Tax=Paenibacillus sp. GCM10023252 TaxID=3252649 RepID=UPI00361FBD95
MIERFSITAELGEMAEAFRVEKIVRGYTNKFNVAPIQTVSIVMNNRLGQRVMDESRWGLFPFWAKDSINADVTTLESKPFFERMLRRQRCVVPCSGFFGWQPVEQERDPRAMHIVVNGQPLFGMAGFYDIWTNARGEEQKAFTVVTAAASGTMSRWQQQVPIILDEEGMEDWMNPDLTEFRRLRKHLEPLESYQMRAYPVTNAIKSEEYESEDCVREIYPADFALY